MGNTDPESRIEKLLFGVKSTSELPKMAGRLKSEEVSNEIFGMLGYKDASRFYRNDEEQAKYEEENPQQPPLEIQVKREELKIRDGDNKSRHQREIMKLEKEAQLEFARLAIEKGFNYDQLMQQLGISQRDDRTKRDVAAASNVTKMSEARVKREVSSGI